MSVPEPVQPLDPLIEPTAKDRSVLRRIVSDPLGVGCLAFLLFVIFLGLSSPWLAPVSPNVAELGAVNAPRSRQVISWAATHRAGTSCRG